MGIENYEKRDPFSLMLSTVTLIKKIDEFCIILRHVDYSIFVHYKVSSDYIGRINRE